MSRSVKPNFRHVIATDLCLWERATSFSRKKLFLKVIGAEVLNKVDIFDPTPSLNAIGITSREVALVVMSGLHPRGEVEPISYDFLRKGLDWGPLEMHESAVAVTLEFFPNADIMICGESKFSPMYTGHLAVNVSGFTADADIEEPFVPKANIGFPGQSGFDPSGRLLCKPWEVHVDLWIRNLAGRASALKNAVSGGLISPSKVVGEASTRGKVLFFCDGDLSLSYSCCRALRNDETFTQPGIPELRWHENSKDPTTFFELIAWCNDNADRCHKGFQ